MLPDLTSQGIGPLAVSRMNATYDGILYNHKIYKHGILYNKIWRKSVTPGKMSCRVLKLVILAVPASYRSVVPVIMHNVKNDCIFCKSLVYYNYSHITMVIRGIIMIIAAGKFKAECLTLMDRVNETHEEIIISKRGKPVAKLIAAGQKPVKSAFGYLSGSVREEHDIVSPTGETWNAE